MKFSVSGGNKNAKISLNEKKDGDILYLTVSMTLPEAEIPKTFEIKWFFPASDIASTWNPGMLDIHGLGFEWGQITVKTRLASWMPVQELISAKGRNKLLIAVSDVDTPVSIKTGLREEDAKLSFSQSQLHQEKNTRQLSVLTCVTFPIMTVFMTLQHGGKMNADMKLHMYPKVQKCLWIPSGTASIRCLTGMKSSRNARHQRK